MAEAVEPEVPSNEALLAEGLSDALASQEQVAIAPDVQDVTVADSINPPEELQTPPTQSWMEKLGIQATDEDEALDRLRQNMTAGQQYYQQAQYLARQQQELQAKLNAFEAAKQVAQQPQAPAQPEKPKVPWDVPKYDATWDEWIDPATGGWIDVTPPQVKHAHRRYLLAQREALNKIITSPGEALAPVIEERARELMAPMQQRFEALEAQLANQAQQQKLQSFLAPYTSQLFVVDANTGEVQRDQYGNPMQTPMGQHFNQTAAGLRQAGFTNDEQIAMTALAAAENFRFRTQPAAQPVQAAPTRQQQDAAIYKKNGTNGATRQPNRGNTINASQGVDAPLQNNRFSAEDLFRQGLREQFPNGIPIG